MCYNVDIHPNYYEEGTAYTWRKIKDVEFTADMVSIDEVDYSDYIDEEGELREEMY
jgi:hypothetical protein